MKNYVVGILAHVDSGKTTLSEGILYETGSIRKIGRVDNQDAFLDTFDLERERGITIFSKQAMFSLGEDAVTLLDTPGHVDFSAEMERTLQVLDYAILVISAADGIQGHTQTLWRLLLRYNIPVVLFFNKMDQPGVKKQELLLEVKERFSQGCIDFTNPNSQACLEEIALTDEKILEKFLEEERIGEKELQDLVLERKVFPCYFGSALKMQGVRELLEGLGHLMKARKYPNEFGAKVFKIARDEQGNRLTYLKLTGGILKVKDSLSNQGSKKEAEIWEEKVNQIRVYSGEKYQILKEASAGMVCCVTGLTKTYPGEGLGMEPESALPVLVPVLNYKMILPPEESPAQMLPKLRILEEEEPELHIVWREELQEIQVQIMGEVQTEILASLIYERFGVMVTFGQGNIVYRETIRDTVEGVGHFEPLRHYAEVHLRLEPGEAGSGMQFAADCSEDILSRNWQRLVLTHLEEREHKGVLTGSAITDMKITLVSGRAHLKHTEGGDFRQATYRAVRQGLMQAENQLLEPYYAFRLELPEQMTGRGMLDIENMHGTIDAPIMEHGMAVLTGTAPVSTMQGYQKEVTSYTRGQGKLFCTFHGYGPCHNAEEVIEEKQYDPQLDVNHSPDSVFCAHGAGFIVPWDQVTAYMHMESMDLQGNQENIDYLQKTSYPVTKTAEEAWIGTEEIDAILDQTFRANTKSKNQPGWKGKRSRKAEYIPAVTRDYSESERTGKRTKKREEYLLVDGYNIIFAWKELKELAEENVDGARGKLLDIMSDYQGTKKCHLIVVFDAYRVKGHTTEMMDYHNIHVVYTKEAETADQYIERFAHENGKKYEVTVATSDGLEQIIITGQGCTLISAREFEKEVHRSKAQLRNEFLENKISQKTYLLDHLTGEQKEKLLREQ